MLELIKVELKIDEYGKCSGSFNTGELGGNFSDIDNENDYEASQQIILNAYSEADKCYYCSEDLTFLSRDAKTVGIESIDIVRYILNRKLKTSTNSNLAQNIPYLVSMLESEAVAKDLKSLVGNKLKQIIEGI